MVDACIYVTAYTMDANEAQEEYEEVQTELRKKEEEVSCLLSFVVYVTYMYNDWEGNKEFCLKTESFHCNWRMVFPVEIHEDMRTWPNLE